MNSEIYIIIVNYKQPDITVECVESIMASTYKNIKVIIVDNCSMDGSYEKLLEIYKGVSNVIIINSPCNYGFSAGNNIGIKYALNHGADYVMLLNNDTIIDTYMIEKLLELADNRTVVVPKMYYFSEKNKIWYAGGHYNRYLGTIKHYGLNKIDSGQFNKNKEVNFATGCCMLISKEIINKVGLMDENYFMYGEDLDYSIKIQLKGMRIMFVSDAKLWHKIGSSSSSSKLNIYYDTRNRFMLFSKFGFPTTAKFLFLFKIVLLNVRGILLKTNDRYFIKAYKDYKNGIKGKINLNNI